MSTPPMNPMRWILICILAFPFSLEFLSGQESERVSTPKQAAEPASLTLVTYNVLSAAVQTDKRLPALLEILRTSDADVIALQEVAPWFLDGLRNQAWSKEWYQTQITEDKAMGGLLILSKWPIQESEVRNLPSQHARVALLVRLNLPGQSMTIVTCHLESPLEAHKERVAQIRLIYQMLAGKENAVLLGDMNFGDKDEPEQQVQDPSFVDAWTKLKPEDPGFTWDKEVSEMARKGSFPHEDSRRIDRIYLKSSKWKPDRIEIIGDQPLLGKSKELFPSDHFGLKLTLALKNK